MNFSELEAKDGARFSWNVLPTTPLEGMRLPVPVACMFTPLKNRANLQVVDATMAVCKTETCGAVLNPYCHMDVLNGVWGCPFCQARNNFPSSRMQEIVGEKFPVEVQQSNTTVEYIVGKPTPSLSVAGTQGMNFLPPGGPFSPSNPPGTTPQPNKPLRVATTFVFVIDTTIDADEMVALKKALAESIRFLHDDAIVMVITFGRNAEVQALPSLAGLCPTSFLFSGTRQASLNSVKRALGVQSARHNGASAEQKIGLVMGREYTRGPRAQRDTDNLHDSELKQARTTTGRQLLLDFVAGLTCDGWSVVPAPTASSQTTKKEGNNNVFGLEQKDVTSSISRDDVKDFRDAEVRTRRQRPQCCSGIALDVATYLLQLAAPKRPGRVVALLGGAVTAGPGKIVGIPLEQHLRGHLELTRREAPFVQEASAYFGQIGRRLAQNGHVCDLFCMALDQIGVMEMSVIAERSGGLLVLEEGFATPTFQHTFSKVIRGCSQPLRSYQGDVFHMGYRGVVDVLCSAEWSVTGCIGPCVPIRQTNQKGGLTSLLRSEKKHAATSPITPSKTPDVNDPYSSGFSSGTESQGSAGVLGKRFRGHRTGGGWSTTGHTIGHGGTCSFQMGGVDPKATLCFYMSMNGNQRKSAGGGKQQQQQHQAAQQAYIQFCTQFTDNQGYQRLRVTTIAKPFAGKAPPQQPQDNIVSTSNMAHLRSGFDQECGATVMARWAVWKLRQDSVNNVLRFIDQHLIGLVRCFAGFVKGDVSTFRLTNEFAFYPQFMYHLRRSQFMQVFNSSPDETAFFRSMLCRECTTNCLRMIQPTLLAFSLDGPAIPVQLDVSACSKDRILFLDTFFYLCIWLGGNIHRWKVDRVYEREGYGYLKDLLAAPEMELKRLSEGRLPFPRISRSVEGGSQSRFVIAKLNPSITQATVVENANTEGPQSEPPVFTEDVSLREFLGHLQKLVVTGKS